MIPIKPLTVFLFLTLLVACDLGPGGGPEPSDQEPVLHILSPTQVSENGFQINWSIENPVGFQSIFVQVAANEDMSNSIDYVHIDDLAD